MYVKGMLAFFFGDRVFHGGLRHGSMVHQSLQPIALRLHYNGSGGTFPMVVRSVAYGSRLYQELLGGMAFSGAVAFFRRMSCFVVGTTDRNCGTVEEFTDPVMFLFWHC